MDYPEPESKTLRVEYMCVCGDGYLNERNETTGLCLPCPKGRFKTKGMLTCENCQEGQSQYMTGQVGGYWGLAPTIAYLGFSGCS